MRKYYGQFRDANKPRIQVFGVVGTQRKPSKHVKSMNINTHRPEVEIKPSFLEVQGKLLSHPVPWDTASSVLIASKVYF